MKKVGVLGGGQLGRMLIQAAIDLDVEIHILEKDKTAPCRHVATRFEIGDITDFDTVYAFGKTVDLLTIEIENVNVDALAKLEEEGLKVFPQPDVIRTIQDKRLQKQFYKQHHIPTADFVLINDKADLEAHQSFLPAFQKLGTEGYDGRGVQLLNDINDFHKAFEKPSLLEKAVDIEKELSVIVARNENGAIKTFPVVELVFNPKYNLVDYLLSPAQVSEEVAATADSIAREVITAFDMIGLLAVEMFLDKEGNILVNEVAPRPHNSGHHSIKANYTSQFEQHLRAILNLPLGETKIKTPAAMINILGAEGHKGVAEYDGVEEALAVDGAYIHLYGKHLTKPSRKMGHLTILDNDIEELKNKVAQLKGVVKAVTKSE